MEAKQSLADLAREIVEQVKESDDHEIGAAMLAVDARRRVEAGEAGKISWSGWAREHIKLSSSRLSELLRIGQADDPRAELEKVRAQTRERVQKLRATRASQKSALEPERRNLIDWAKSAPIDAVKRMLKATAEDLEVADPLA